MLRLRLLDERMLALQRQGRIGFYGLSTGGSVLFVLFSATHGGAPQLTLQAPDW
jgi:TPP-dependent pyruvate/acetoin dehydrogenase alpha subunit